MSHAETATPAHHLQVDAAAAAKSLPASLPARCPRSPLDPAGLLHRAFVQQPPASAAEDTLIAWLMSLNPEIDPADAARCMIEARREVAAEDSSAGNAESDRSAAGEAARLMTLLEETARWPAERLARARGGRGQRRGHGLKRER